MNMVNHHPLPQQTNKQTYNIINNAIPKQTNIIKQMPSNEQSNHNNSNYNNSKQHNAITIPTTTAFTPISMYPLIFCFTLL
eukprot:m.96762 g.96762  ORF g.96762 m.96762 type:complete len:81 (-) comp8972_c2_seq1:24-266(-)